MERCDIEKIRSIFYNVQFNKTSHKKYHETLMDTYKQHNLGDFFTEFMNCLMIVLHQNEKDSHVHNVLEFAANFAVSQENVSDKGNSESEQMSLLLTKIFKWLLSHHNVKDISMRFGICSFINTLLNAMGPEGYIDDDLCDKITNNMTERLQDKSSKVRAQAILALRRLQEPRDKECPVIKLFVNHLLRDPSADVRKAVLSCMAKTQMTLANVLKKVRDINEDVRKMSYLFISKVTVKSLSIQQREFILNSGLKDPSEKVKQTVKNVLLPNWLRHYNNDFIKLLKGLDAENAAEIASSCLKILLKETEINCIIEQIQVDKSTRVIPVDKLTSENIMLWRHFVEYLKNSNLTDYLEVMLPELSEFCNYVGEFINKISDTSSDSWEAMSQRFILLNLFEMSKLYDLSDEAGRVNLKQLMTNTLLSKNIFISDISQTIIECIVNCMENVVPNVDERLTALAHVISELRMPVEQRSQPEQITEDESNDIKMKKAELRVKLNVLTEELNAAVKHKNFKEAEELKNQIEKIEGELKAMHEKVSSLTDENNEELCEEEKNDDETLWKCLSIMSTMMQANSVTSLTPTIRTVMENIALTNIMHENVLISSLALKVIGICCLLDRILAKKYFITFVLYIAVEGQNEEIFKVALAAVLDMLVCYGLQHFDIKNVAENTAKRNKTMKLYNMDNEKVEETCEIEDNSNNIITNIIKLLDHENEEYQYVVIEGLCKLLLTEVISSSNLLSHLIIMLFNPVTERNSSLRRTLIHFFNCYANVVPESQNMLEDIFMPTLRILENAPSSSPLEQVDPLKVAEMMLGFTACNATKYCENDYTVHNKLTFKILNEILESQFSIDLDILVKSLKFLNVKFDDAQKELVLIELKKAEEVVQHEEKHLVKSIQQFRCKIEGNESENKAEYANDEEKDE